MVARRLQILKEAVPAASKIVALVGSSAEEERSKGAVATKLMLEIDETHLSRAFAELAEEKVDAILVAWISRCTPSICGSAWNRRST